MWEIRKRTLSLFYHFSERVSSLFVCEWQIQKSISSDEDAILWMEMARNENGNKWQTLNIITCKRFNMFKLQVRGIAWRERKMCFVKANVLSASAITDILFWQRLLGAFKQVSRISFIQPCKHLVFWSPFPDLWSRDILESFSRPTLHRKEQCKMLSSYASR